MNANIQLALWIAHPVLELSLAGIMFWRRLHRTFPVFFAYIVFQVVNFLILFPIYKLTANSYGTQPESLYFYAYWISAAISLAIGFMVIHEIFLDVLRPYPNLKDLGTLMFKWAALVMFLVALVVTAASQSGMETPIAQAVIIVQRCVRVIQCGLILFLLFFSRHLGLSRKQFSFGIALGFGSFASIELVGVALISGGQIHTPTVNLIYATAYSLSILTWMGYALLKTTSREESSKLLMSRRWDQGLSELRNPVAGDSLIPMFESMVDRAFSRAPAEAEHAEVEVNVKDKHIAHKMTVTSKAASSFSAGALRKNLVR
ncbi:MAG: hypothetical protein WB711_05320 [Terriglobales bacterium]